MPELPKESAHLVVYSPPFADLYNYSSSDRDLSNCRDYGEFMEHYRFVVTEANRILQPGRIACVHCTDIPIPGQKKGYRDFPGDIIRLHTENGFYYHGRVSIWKEPFRVAIRTRLQSLMHRTLVKDATLCSVAVGDSLLLFKKYGENKNPVTMPVGLSEYAGRKDVPEELRKFKGEKRQEKNRLSQWIWRQYASCFWDDVRIERVLPYRAARDVDDEKHVCPLQLDVIERCVTLWSSEGETVLTPFMGVGSEVYMAVAKRRRAIGIELKKIYFRQSIRNVASAIDTRDSGKECGLFDEVDSSEEEMSEELV